MPPVYNALPNMAHSELHKTAVKHLRRQDKVLGAVIQQVGPFKLKLERDRFTSLVRAIVSQQISGSAAKSILARLGQLVGPQGYSAEGLLRLTPEKLRTAGVSPQKAGYLLDLAEKVHAGQVHLAKAGRLSDEDLIAELTQIKGIGVWTAQMFLMFSLGRLDVLPHGDLGVRAAIKKLYQLEDLPDRDTCHRIAEPWRPYASVASWYCWRSLELRTVESASR